MFFLLTGSGAWLARERWSTGELSRFLLTRGLWLIFLELVVVRCFGYQFNVDYQVTMLVVLWALGWAMITGHNLFDDVRAPSALWHVLHAPGVVAPPRHMVFAAYPLVPWIGVTAVGYGLGLVHAWPAERRRAFLWRSAAALTAAFVVLRRVNRYGDPSRWTTQHYGVATVLSFLNTTKYPPSLLFLLMTLGPALFFLWCGLWRVGGGRDCALLVVPVVRGGEGAPSRGLAQLSLSGETRLVCVSHFAEHVEAFHVDCGHRLRGLRGVRGLRQRPARGVV